MTEKDEIMPSASETHTGIFARIRARTPDFIKNNAVRIVACMKMSGFILMLFSKNRFFSITGGGFIAANSILAIFGKQKSAEEKERLGQEHETEENAPKKGIITDFTNKLFHPNKYPVEAGYSIGMLSDSAWIASGLFGKGGFSPTRLFGGLLSLAADTNIVLTKERIGDAQANPYKKKSIKYYVTELRNRPVLLSSLMNVSSDLTSIIGGAREWRKGKEINTLLAGTFLFLANTFQGIFVNKNDYNTEKQPETGKTVEKQNTQTSEVEETTAIEDKNESDTAKQTSWQKRVNASPKTELTNNTSPIQSISA